MRSTTNAQLTEAGGMIEVRFTYDLEMVVRVRTLDGRAYVPKPGDKHWTCTLNMKNVRLLRDWDFELDWALEDWESKATLPPNVAKLEWTGKACGLYPYQKDGVAWIDKRNGLGILGDEMGLGKTAQALVYADMNPDDRLPAIVVCPATLKENWRREVIKWTDLTTCIINGRKQTKLPDADIYIVNYSIIRRERKNTASPKAKRKKMVAVPNTGWGDWLGKQVKVRTLILDEAHKIKESTTGQTKAVKRLRKGIPHVLPLTGTPIINNPGEFFEMIKLVAPSLFPIKFDYQMRYCDPKKSWFAPCGYEFNGASNTEELHELVGGKDGCMLRRLKADVLPDLPTKRRIVMAFEIDNMAKYIEAELAFKDWADSPGTTNQATALSKLETLKQIAVAGKLKACIEWIEDFLATGKKLVMFCHHKSTASALAEHFGKRAVSVVGGTTKRMEKVDRFQNDASVHLFIGSLAAIEGLNLTAEDTVAFVELWWAPAQHDQGIDRVHRIGQDSDRVDAYFLIAAHTVEERIAKLLDKKRKVVDAILDGRDTGDDSLLLNLLDEYRRKGLR